MEPIHSIQQSTVGIVLAVLVVSAVGGATFVFERPTSAVPIAQTISSTTSAPPSTTASTVPVQSASKAAVVSSSVSARTSSGEGGDDDGVARSTAPISNSPQPVNTPVVSTPPPVIVPKQTASVYKNGTYTATGSYGSPGGQEQLSVTLTLVNDIITAVSVTPGAYDRRSQNYQNIFISGYKQYVVGKNIADVNLGTISGSSLTPIGFNDALAQIKAQAKA